MQNNLLGILSDTHDNRNTIIKAVEIFNKKGTGLVAHAGDFIAPFTALDFKQLACPMEMVFGNNDGEKIGLQTAFRELGNLMQGPRSFCFGGKRFLLMHEDNCLDVVGSSADVDVILYGHTHSVDIRRGSPLIINPGEAGGWLHGKATIAVLDIETMEVEVIDLKP